MIPPNTNELNRHSDDLADFGRSLHNLNGAGKALVNATAAVVALIAVLIFLAPVLVEIV